MIKEYFYALFKKNETILLEREQQPNINYFLIAFE
jgi:hypothetical protein